MHPADLAALCRTARHALGAGLSAVRTFRQLARSGPPSLRSAAGRVADALESGSTLADALRAEPTLPSLFTDLVAAGEEAGAIEVVLGELEQFYDRESALRRRFQAAITWPVLQAGAAVVVVALLLIIAGMLTDASGRPVIDPLGVGLVGPLGAIVFVGGVAVVVGLGVLAWRLFAARLSGGAFFGVPILGPALRALALTRFTLALRLTWEAGLSAPGSVRRAFAAAGNTAFAAAGDGAARTVRRGRGVTEALRETELFPGDYLAVVDLGEETGNLPEVLARHGRALDEEAGRRLTALVMAASGAIWLAVVVFLVVMIFRIASVYLGAIGA